MTWVKLGEQGNNAGRIFNLNSTDWRTTHAQVPTPLVLKDRIRVYYACRSNGMSFPAFFDLSLDLKTILDVHETSVIESGKPGMFDSDGVMPSCIFTQDRLPLMYYIGWNEKSKTARYHNAIGMAVTVDGINFQRVADGPIMDRTMKEPGLCVMPFVMHDGGVLRMWYQSATAWHDIDGKYEPVYVIKYAESADGINWNRLSLTCVAPVDEFEAFSRPCVIKKSDGYHMMYCYRGSKDYRGGEGSYRIGYAHSKDGITFNRMDEKCDLELGEDGEWDSQMQCYPYVIELNGKFVMFYNGNDFGQTGIGIAVWEDA